MRRMIMAVAALAVVAGACGAATEEIAEQLAEQGGITDVEIDDDQVSFNVETDEGEVSAVIGGGDVPADFPAPVPDGGNVTFSASQSGSDNSSMLALEYPEDQFDSLVSTYENWLADEGFEVQRTETTSEDVRSVLLFGTRSGTPSNAFINIAEDGSGNALVNIQLGDG